MSVACAAPAKQRFAAPMNDSKLAGQSASFYQYWQLAAGRSEFYRLPAIISLETIEPLAADLVRPPAKPWTRMPGRWTNSFAAAAPSVWL